MRYLLLVSALMLSAFLAAFCQQERTVGYPAEGKDDAQATDESIPKNKADTGEKNDTDRKTVTSEEEPLLLLDDEPLLLLDDDGGDDPSVKMADNSRCHVCHLNFEIEDLAVVHAKADVGCTKCHGDCDAHIADESWAIGGNGTPPGKMYYRKDINPCCEECHEKHNVSADKVIARWLERNSSKPGGDPAARIAPEKIACIDCHGEHRMHLEERKCKWK